jgi:hypothetical protein
MQCSSLAYGGANSSVMLLRDVGLGGRRKRQPGKADVSTYGYLKYKWHMYGQKHQLAHISFPLPALSLLR